MSDIKEKPNPFTLSPKLWAKTSWTDKKNVDQFITEYEETLKNRDRQSVTFSLENTAIEIHDGRCSLRFHDNGVWSDNYFFTKFAWSKLGMFFPRYFSGFTRDCKYQYGEQSEKIIEDLYYNLSQTTQSSDRKLVFRLENNVDGMNIIRTVVTESFTEIDDDLLLSKFKEDKTIQDKFVLNARISDTYSNIRIGDAFPHDYELDSPIPMVEFSNADNGGKSLKARSGTFTGKCWNSLCSLNTQNIKKWFHTGDINRINENFNYVYTMLFNNSSEMIEQYKKSQDIPVRINENFTIFKGTGKKKQLITHGHLNKSINKDIACKSLIESSLPNRVRFNGKHVSALTKSFLTWNDPKMITKTSSLARCVDALTLHAQQYEMESRVAIEDYASYLLDRYIHCKEISIDPMEKLITI